MSASVITFPQDNGHLPALRIERFRPNLGATVEGIDLSRDLSAETQAILKRGRRARSAVFPQPESRQ
jgi:hypothetical protein